MPEYSMNMSGLICLSNGWLVIARISHSDEHWNPNDLYPIYQSHQEFSLCPFHQWNRPRGEARDSIGPVQDKL